MAKRAKKKKPSPQVMQAKQVGASGGTSSQFALLSWKVVLQALLIILAGIWVFGPALHGDWLWDDDNYITDNWLLHDPARLWKIWFSPGSLRDYYPITFTVQLLQWDLWHNDTLGYHITNLVLHLFNALLVWKLLTKFNLRLAWLGGLLFAIHPVQVESAAWISELKNTLSLFGLLGAMIFYLDYEERKRRSDYLLALGLFGVALLCKISVVMFPVVLLLYAWWKRNRIGWSDLKTSAPFFVISLVLGLITILGGIWDQQFNHLSPDKLPLGGLPARLVLAGQEIAFYFSKSFLPVELLPVYPKWSANPFSPLHYLPWLVLGAGIYCLWAKRESWGRHALLGLGFFLINLAPCPGFIPAPNMGYAWVMDHFLYLPIIGLIGLVVAVAGQMEKQIPRNFRPAGIGVMGAILMLLVWKSHGYAKLYIDQETFWTYTLQCNPQAYIAHEDLGLDLQQRGRKTEAIEHFEQALQLKPDDPEIHNNLGVVLQQIGQVSEALKQCEQALQLKPDYAEAHYNMGVDLERIGQTVEAIKQYEQSLHLKPDYADAHDNLGVALQRTGRVDEAIEHYEQALQFKPDFAEAHNNLSNALISKGQFTEAIEQCDQAIQIKPDYAEAHNNLGIALAQSGRVAEAIGQFERALQIDPNYADTRNNLEHVKALQKNRPATN